MVYRRAFARMMGPGADDNNDGRAAVARRDQEQWTWRSKEDDGRLGGKEWELNDGGW